MTNMFRFLLLLFFVISYNSLGRENESSAFLLTDNSVRIIAAGDVMAHMGQVKSATNKDGTYDFNKNYQFVKPYIESADIAFCNFETVLGDKPFSGFPAFSSPDTIANAVKYAGFDIAFTANNHCLDRRATGLTKTVRKLLTAGLLTTGTFVDSNDKKHRNIIYVTKNNIKIAFLNYTYATNGFTVNPPYLVNYINKDEIVKTLKQAKSEKPDAIIVFFHWGSEYQRVPNSSQIDLAKICYENGADVIIGAHPHVIQKMEKINYKTPEGKTKEILIAYSLGNLISNQTWRYSDGGIFADFTLKKDQEGKISISNAEYKPVYVLKNSSEGKKNYYLIFPDKLEEYKELKIPESDKKKIREFESDTKKLMSEFK